MVRPSEIRDRFLTEQDYIQRYVRLLEAKAKIRQAEVRDVANLLHRYRLPTIPTPSSTSTRGEPFSAQESADLRSAIKDVRPSIEKALAEAEREFRALEAPENIDRVDVRSIIGEWIQCFVDALEMDASPMRLDSLRQQALEQIRRDKNELGGESSVPTPEDIEYAIRSAVYLASYRKFDALAYVLDNFTEFELVTRLTEPETEVSILRQGFILLMTAFDAAIFDLVRVAIRKDFFGSIAAFSTRDKLSLDTLGKYKDFEAFRDSLIEEQLRGQYLKDLLFRLNRMSAICSSQSDNKTFSQLIELVNRRNIHIHNRGVVDERYLERDEQGNPRFNIYNLKFGDMIGVDHEYWDSANALCQNCIQEVVTWAENKGQLISGGGSSSAISGA